MGFQKRLPKYCALMEQLYILLATTSTMNSDVLTAKARDDIVLSLATLMVHTAYPSQSDFKTVLSKLVKKHPVLKDCVGSGYVSYLNIHMYTSAYD